MSSRLRLAALLSLASGAIHCGPPAYSEVQAVYTQSCAVGRSCHGTIGPSPVLAAGLSHASTVNVNATQIAMPLITPGSLERSYLWHKINGTMDTLPQCSMANCGSRMPMVGGGMLEPAQVETIRRWILAGAPAQ
jgi:hypothetical protein